MRLTLVMTLTLTAVLAVSPALWAQETAAESQASGLSVGFVPENAPAPTINVSTDITGDSTAGLTSRSTEQVLDRLVNIQFVNADLENALRLIARQMDLNIIIGPGARGRTITLDLRDVPLRFALDAILRSNDLGYIVERGGIVRIVPASAIMPETVERQTLIRRLNWVLASQVENILTDFITTQGTIRSDVQTNSIIVSDVPARIQDIDNLIDQLDVPERQVMIEARLVDISENALRQLDSEFSISEVDSEGVAPFNQIVNPILGETSGASTPRDALGFGGNTVSTPTAVWTLGEEVLGYDITARLRAFEEEGLARVLAAPRVATLNNLPALIDIKREIPYVEAVQGPTQGTTTNEVEFKDVGLQLEVIPTITNNGFVRMEVRTEQLIPVDFVAGVPVVDRRTSRTNIIVQDGLTVILGGLRQLTNIDAENGVPWFRKIPALGFLFRGDSVSRDRLDFYAFVTPTILHDPNLAAAERYAHDLLDLEWNVPRDYFFDDEEIEVTY